MAENKTVARKTPRKKVKMFGTGNFHIGTDLYPFRDGETVTAIHPDHVPLLEAEAERRENIAIKVSAITEAQKNK